MQGHSRFLLGPLHFGSNVHTEHIPQHLLWSYLVSHMNKDMIVKDSQRHHPGFPNKSTAGTRQPGPSTL